MKSELYFKHDIYTLEDSKVMALVYRYHEAGYGVFWAMLEKLTAEPEHRLPMQVLTMQVAMKLVASKPAKVAEILNCCVEVGLLKEENGLVFNERILRQCDDFEKYKRTQSENVKKRWERYRATNTTVDETNNETATAVAERNTGDRERANTLVARYHELCPSLPKVRTVTDARITHVRTLMSAHEAEVIDEVFRKAEQSDFLKHGNGTWNGANFDWLINQNNFTKVLEGNYDNHTRRSRICNDPAEMSSGMNGNGGFDL